MCTHPKVQNAIRQDWSGRCPILRFELPLYIPGRAVERVHGIVAGTDIDRVLRNHRSRPLGPLSEWSREDPVLLARRGIQRSELQIASPRIHDTVRYRRFI